MISFAMLTAFCIAILALPSVSKAAESGIVNQPPTEDFDHSAVLIPNVYKLYWKATGDQPNDTITFEVRVATKGWIGLGFSPNGNMPGADIVVGGVDKNGVGYLWDRFATTQGLPGLDAQQDYKLLFSSETESGTVLKFQRLLNTCDRKNDYVLGTDTVKMIFAFNTKDAESETNFEYHQDHRGAQSVLLFRQQLDKTALLTLAPEVVQIELKVKDVAVTAKTTTVYWCQPFDLSDRFNASHDLIRFDTLVDPRNVKYVHHMILYQCYYNITTFGRGGYCYERDENGEVFEGTKYCNQRWTTSWAIGGTDAIYPEDLGVPLFDGSSTVFMLQIHYNNPWRDSFVDSSGVRLYLTPKHRPVQAASLLLGLTVSPMTIIPPRQKSAVFYSVCPTNCTEAIPDTGVDVFGVGLHAHLIGVALRIRHFRNGNELAPLASDIHYDFNYQERRLLANPVKVLPGDVLVMECTYNSTDRSQVTFGGRPSEDEMCFGFLEYYPKVPAFAACFSLPDPESLAAALNVTLITPGVPVITGPNGNPTTLPDYAAKNYSWVSPGEILNANGHTAAAESYLRTLTAGTHHVECIGAKTVQSGRIDQVPGEPDLLEAFDKRIVEKASLPDLTRPLTDDNDPCSASSPTASTDVDWINSTAASNDSWSDSTPSPGADDWLNSTDANVDWLNSTDANVDSLNSTNANVDWLNSTDANVDWLNSTDTNVDWLNSIDANVDWLNSTDANVDWLNSTTTSTDDASNSTATQRPSDESWDATATSSKPTAAADRHRHLHLGISFLLAVIVMI